MVDPATNPENPKEKFGLAKPCIEFISPSAILELATVMALGGKKYGPFNWRTKKVKFSTYYSAAFRHMALAFSGEDRDPESKALHLAHAMACMMILIDAHHHDALIDDRPKSEKTREIMDLLTASVAG